MIKKSLNSVFLLIGLLFCGCTSGMASAINIIAVGDTLKYTYKTIKQRNADCGNKPDSSCTVADIKYPLFVNQSVLNAELKQTVLNVINKDNLKYKTINQAIIAFLKAYDDDKKKFITSIPYTLVISADVTWQGTGLTVIKTSKYSYEGGAHGSSCFTFLNWNLQTNRRITLKELFIANYREKLNKIAERIFRKQQNLADTASLLNGYFFNNGIFYLNNNFSITPSGLKFLYNEYEIKSYAEGTTELLIPYSQIKSLLKPNTVLAQYIK